MEDDRKKIEETVDEIIELVLEYLPDADTDMIRRAYELADRAHGQQRRRSGELYITHPVAVAKMLAEFGMDVETIVAALLHDVIEDTSYKYEDIAEEFNDDIAYMVESVSKITRMSYMSKEESQAEYVRKMVLAMSNDLRIILIKLFDRLHNMRTLEYMSTSKQFQKSRETLEIYAPIANRLGIQTIKNELENLAFKYIDPQNYEQLRERVKARVGEESTLIEELISQVQTLLEENGIEAQVQGRVKELYSIYRKMRQQNLSFDEIYDLIAVRIITNSIEDVYTALGIIHTNWTAIPGRMKDYITQPKSNGYQSFHTTVIGPTGTPLEIQIRTKEMHIQNEYGIAAHWVYKEGRKKTKKRDKKFERDISWIRQLIAWEDDFDSASSFLETMKEDILDELVFVYTPEGDVIELPAGSTPLDFAYRIHTDIGNQCIGAKVNQKIVPLSYQLKLGDIVQIMTSKNGTGPRREWLDYVKSAHARNKIRQFIKKSDSEANIAFGKHAVEGILKQRNNAAECLDPKKLEAVANALNYKTLNDLYLAVGVTSVRPSTVLAKLELLYPELFPSRIESITTVEEPPKTGNSAVSVQGMQGIETHLARCCNPVPGDSIIGYTTYKRYVTVHRTDCKNVTQLDTDRLVEVKWNDLPHRREFLAELYIETFTKRGGLMDVLQPFYKRNFPIISTNSKTSDTVDFYNIVCEVRSVEDLKHLIKELREIPFVAHVERV